MAITVAVGFAHGRHDPATLLDRWRQWDTGWYLEISRRGYFEPAATVFFPLYPAAMAAVAAVAGDQFRLAGGLMLANAGGLAAIAGVVALGAREAGDTVGRRAARLFLAYPFAFYLAAAYTEGPFAAFAVWSLAMARRGRWGPAAGLAFLAALTRVTAVILILPLLWELGRQRGWWNRWTLPVAGAVPAAVALYAAYLWRRFGDPLLFLKEQSRAWHRQPIDPVTVLPRAAARILRLPLLDETRWVQTAEVAAVLLFALLTLFALRRQPLSFTIYMAALIYLSVGSPIVTGPYYLQSAGRFLVVAAPAFLYAARRLQGRAWLEVPLLAISSGLQALFLGLFLAGHVIE
ncbi:MAG TPA: hypothetical protein VF160_13870 [Candidatus Dormibacteraeota bacterium]